jgi:hypothetical protein
VDKCHHDVFLRPELNADFDIDESPVLAPLPGFKAILTLGKNFLNVCPVSSLLSDASRSEMRMVRSSSSL